MSLNFVSSAVLSSTDGISHNEEKPIESVEAEQVRRSAAAKPLFEQLQYNRDKAQEEYEAVTKAMRGTRTLDDEDCAHLESIEAAKLERERQLEQSIGDEVAMFRAARADRSIQIAGTTNGDNTGTTESTEPRTTQLQTESTSNSSSRRNPFVIVSKKRRRNAPADDASPKKGSTVDVQEGKQPEKKEVDKSNNNELRKDTIEPSKAPSSSLSGLLANYSSDESD